jgi:ribosomal protein L11 methyltransferase
MDFTRRQRLSQSDDIMASDDSYIAVVFDTDDARDDVQAVLFTLEPLGFLDEDSTWTCYFDATAWRGGLRERFISLISAHFPAVTYAAQEFVKQNWNKEWEDSIVPIEVSDRFLIAPSWNIPPDEHKLVLVIDPKMSFGTGFHETTRLMLRLMERASIPGQRVLDVGTGTGVLAIAAVKLGAASAFGVDIDEWSYDNAMENAERNGVTEAVDFAHGSVEKAEGLFDVILSNITRNDNIALFPRLSSMTAAPGALIVSGFYREDVDAVTDAARALGFIAMETLAEHEWAAIRFDRAA